MATDQIQKMKKYRTSPDATVFVLSWTLTQNSESASGCNTSFEIFPSVIMLANRANPEIYSLLWRSLSPTLYPNVLYTDNINQTLNLELALAINYLATP